MEAYLSSMCYFHKVYPINSSFSLQNSIISFSFLCREASPYSQIHPRTSKIFKITKIIILQSKITNHNRMNINEDNEIQLNPKDLFNCNRIAILNYR